jgi:2-amino-4-hydroxy-6-hydroxymethyldihydropteridine diphosphokinase
LTIGDWQLTIGGMEGMTAYIALGSNVGDREATLRRALMLMETTCDIQVVRISHFVQTDPVGGPSGQEKYLNGVAQIVTGLSPHELLAELRQVEWALGRDRQEEQRWGPRTCDLDILLMGEVVIDTPDLTIPHPRMHERLFVLEPLDEIAPEAMHPVLKVSARDLLTRLISRHKGHNER